MIFSFEGDITRANRQIINAGTIHQHAVGSLRNERSNYSAAFITDQALAFFKGDLPSAIPADRSTEFVRTERDRLCAIIGINFCGGPVDLCIGAVIANHISEENVEVGIGRLDAIINTRRVELDGRIEMCITNGIDIELCVQNH